MLPADSRHRDTAHGPRHSWGAPYTGRVDKRLCATWPGRLFVSFVYHITSRVIIRAMPYERWRSLDYVQSVIFQAHFSHASANDLQRPAAASPLGHLISFFLSTRPLFSVYPLQSVRWCLSPPVTALRLWRDLYWGNSHSSQQQLADSSIGPLRVLYFIATCNQRFNIK